MYRNPFEMFLDANIRCYRNNFKELREIKDGSSGNGSMKINTRDKSVMVNLAARTLTDRDGKVLRNWLLGFAQLHKVLSIRECAW